MLCRHFPKSLTNDEFDKLRPLCYTNTNIFLLCFSVESPSSFQTVSEKWVPEILCQCPKAPIILVETKSDLREDVKVLIELDKCKEKPVPEEVAKLCAEEIKAECSALTQKNLKEVFDAAIVDGIQYSDTQQQPKKSKSRTPDKMKNLSKSWWKNVLSSWDYRCAAPRLGHLRSTATKEGKRQGAEEPKAYSTRCSQAVSHPSTNQARPCLASEIRRDRARSGWYGRRRWRPPLAALKGDRSQARPTPGVTAAPGPASRSPTLCPSTLGRRAASSVGLPEPPAVAGRDDRVRLLRAVRVPGLPPALRLAAAAAAAAAAEGAFWIRRRPSGEAPSCPFHSEPPRLPRNREPAQPRAFFSSRRTRRRPLSRTGAGGRSPRCVPRWHESRQPDPGKRGADALAEGEPRRDGWRDRGRQRQRHRERDRQRGRGRGREGQRQRATETETERATERAPGREGEKRKGGGGAGREPQP
ncbi:Rho-related GTP-binding protein RhoU [Plecturocebus cupreus]